MSFALIHNWVFVSPCVPGPAAQVLNLKTPELPAVMERVAPASATAGAKHLRSDTAPVAKKGALGSGQLGLLITVA